MKIIGLGLLDLKSTLRLDESFALFLLEHSNGINPQGATEDIEISQMSAGGAFGGNRGVRPVPPEKGVFPLDHMHLCDLEKKEYINCLKTSGHKSERCRQFSKKYLECRMEKNLMAKQDMSELGFRQESVVETRQDESRNEKIEE